MELNEFGLKVWKHKTNKRLFLQQSYRWKDNLMLLDETEGRQIVDNFTASTFNYSAWEPMTQEEYNSVKLKFTEIYSQNSQVAELVDAALHRGTESYMSAAFKIRTGSNPVLTTKMNVMKNKVWSKTVIATEEQNIEIYPTEQFDGIIIETKEMDDKTHSPRLYLNKDEMELLIVKMQEMMRYVSE